MTPNQSLEGGTLRSTMNDVRIAKNPGICQELSGFSIATKGVSNMKFQTGQTKDPTPGAGNNRLVERRRNGSHGGVS
jgi:hypothetical protein